MNKLVIDNLSYSNLSAQFSEQMALAALPIVAVVALNATAAESASLQAINTLPFLLLSIPAGLLADRSRKKPLMLVTELIRAAALFLLCFLFFSKGLSLSVLGVFGFFIATGTVIYSVTAPALVATLVGKSDLISANRHMEIARSIAYTAGPAVGGMLAGFSSGIFAFFIASLLSIVSMWFLLRLPTEAPKIPSERHLLRELTDGIAFVAQNPYLRPIIITAFVFNISWYLLMAIFSYYAFNNLSFNASEIGIALSLFGVGMVFGSFLYKPISNKLDFGTQIILGPISAFIAALMMGTTIFYPNMLIVLLAFFLFGFGPIVWTISTTTLRQIVTPENMIARVSSVIMTVTFGARPLGAILGVWLSASFGVSSCLIAVVIGFLIQLCIIYFSMPTRIVTLEQLNE
ncbi:MFS transporter [Klebsiella michiganensis]|uniref:MFS transporter n=1 Tax=Klebsiella michiganensis TaxID=1134687 RepID=UPI0032DB582F